MYRIGCNGVVRVDQQKAKELFRDAAESGDAESEFHYGELLLGSSPRQAGDAVTFLMRAAEQDNISAIIRLGELYESGEFVPRDVVRGRDWYRRAGEVTGNQEFIDRANLDHEMLTQSSTRTIDEQMELALNLFEAAQEGSLLNRFANESTFPDSGDFGKLLFGSTHIELLAEAFGFDSRENDPEAQFQLGNLWILQHRVHDAFACYQQTQLLGHPLAALRLSILRFEGESCVLQVVRNPEVKTVLPLEEHYLLGDRCRCQELDARYCSSMALF
jgi:TPR repeat protein